MRVKKTDAYVLTGRMRELCIQEVALLAHLTSLRVAGRVILKFETDFVGKSSKPCDQTLARCSRLQAAFQPWVEENR